MYVRFWFYGVLTCLGFFAIGLSMIAVIRSPILGVTAFALSLGSTITLAIWLCRLATDDGHTTTRRLLRSIHRHVTFLTEEGYELLIPSEGSDSQTVWLRIGAEHDGTVIVEKEGWDGILHRYTIHEHEATILRSALGDDLAESDYAWCHGELTDERHEHLLETLSGSCSPVRSIASP